MLKKAKHEDKRASSSGIAITVQELIALRSEAGSTLADSTKQQHHLPGQKLTRIRGRGIEFDTTREYQPGDDIRSMAWRVTARSLKPHIKVYHEERDRPAWLAIDLSPGMYFGTRCMFKSVCSIRQAALSGWEYLSKRESIGAIIATESKMLIYPPQSSERNFLGILASLADCSTLQPAFNEKNYLRDLLLTLQQRARTGNLIFILSDFYQFDDESKKIISHIAQRAQIVLFFVYDPFEAEAPPPHQYVVTNGEQKTLFNMDNEEARVNYQQQFLAKKNDLSEFARKHNITLKMIRTDQKQED